MTLLDKKIAACEEFLESYNKYFYLEPSNFTECGVVPQMLYRAKIAYVFQFLEKMGIKREEYYKSLDNVEFDPECMCCDNFYPEEETFNIFMTVSPYHSFNDLGFTRETLYEDYIYGDGSVPPLGEDGDPVAEPMVEALESDLLGNYSKQKLKDLADIIIGNFAYEGTEINLFEERDTLFHYFFKKYYEILGANKVIIKPLCKKADAKRIHEIWRSKKFAPVLVDYFVLDVNKDSQPTSDYVYAFGAVDGGYSECYDCTKTNFVYGIQMALIHLYVFRLDRSLNFLPKKLKGGDAKIFPNFK